MAAATRQNAAPRRRPFPSPERERGGATGTALAKDAQRQGRPEVRRNRQALVPSPPLFSGGGGGGGARRPYFIFALIASSASACVYSWLATPPFGMFGSAASKSAWVKARYGTVRSCGIFLPSSTCCATQKASVETPGAIDADQVV